MRTAVSIALVVVLGGCASGGIRSHASHVAGVPVTVAEVQRAVACEFAYALMNSEGDGRDVIASWSAVVELTLIAKDTATVTPGLGKLSGTVGDLTVSTTATLPSMTFDGHVEDQNILTYVARIEDQAAGASCPPQGSPAASSGLELADLLIGTSQVINSGGRIASSTSIITSRGIGPVEGAVVNAGTVIPVAAVRESIPTVKFERGFTVSRKAGGGLSFEVGDYSMTLTGSNMGRARTNNKIVVTMGASQGTLRRTGDEELDAAVDPGAPISLEDSIFQHRRDEIDLLRGLVPNEVIVVTPPAGP